MTQSKKYDLQVTEKDGTWTAKIIRRVNRQDTVVSIKQEGFATEAEAQAWGEKELKTFMENLVVRNKRRSQRRANAKN